MAIILAIYDFLALFVETFLSLPLPLQAFLCYVVLAGAGTYVLGLFKQEFAPRNGTEAFVIVFYAWFVWPLVFVKFFIAKLKQREARQ